MDTLSLTEGKVELKDQGTWEHAEILENFYFLIFLVTKYAPIFKHIMYTYTHMCVCVSFMLNIYFIFSYIIYISQVL